MLSRLGDRRHDVTTSRLTRTLLATAALLALCAVPAWQGTASATDAVVLVGTWQQVPGLDPRSCSPQQVQFLGTMTMAGDHTGAYAVQFQGQSHICETLGAGQGAGVFGGGVAGVVAYARTGMVMALAGDLTVSGSTMAIAWSQCHLQPAPASLPLTTFEIECSLLLLT